MVGTCAKCPEPRAGTGYCRQHNLEYRREYRKRNAQAYRERTLRHKYGIEPEDFERLLAAQDGHCALCPSVKALCVDHDHVTGLVRGILCRKCNAALGMLEDDLARLRAAVKYLERG